MVAAMRRSGVCTGPKNTSDSPSTATTSLFGVAVPTAVAAVAGVLETEASFEGAAVAEVASANSIDCCDCEIFTMRGLFAAAVLG